jgi:uridine kinase
MTPPLVVGIAGGSGSGKTTLARAVVDALGPDRVALVAHDAYYRDRGDLPPEARETLNYDVPEAFDHERFLGDLHRLRAGRPVHPPRYCFVTHRRIGVAAAIEPRDVVVVEGILLFQDPGVRDALDLKIFLDAPGPLRFARRLARDTAERGRTVESVTSQYAATVIAAYVQHVEPTRSLADLVLLNAGRLESVIEVAVAVIRGHVRRRHEEALGARRALA